MLDFLQGPMAQAFALYAGTAGAAAAVGLARDGREGRGLPSRREGLLVPLGLAALAAAFAVGAPDRIRLISGGLLLSGLVLLALAPRRLDRRSAGREIGLVSSWAGIGLALISAFIRHPGPPDLPT